MSRLKKVSVVMAEYNTNDADIHAAIGSVLGQSYKNFEFIIVDDSGVNRVEKILARYNDKRIRVVKNPSNKGFVYALNNGIKHAGNEYIIRMDTDDVIRKDRFEKLINFAEKHPEYAAISSRAVEFTGKKKLGVIGSAGEKGKREVMRGDVPVHAAALIRKSAIEEVGGYKEYKRAEDLALWCELLLAGKRLYMLDDVLYEYRVNPDDYKKRTLRNRDGELKARLYYYPKMNAGPIEYVRVLKSVVAGILPAKLTRLHRRAVVLKNKNEASNE